MNNKGLNIDNIKQEIERKKRETGHSTMPKDTFLNKLKESLVRGAPNESIHKIKEVSNKAAEKATQKTGIPEKKPYSSTQPKQNFEQTQNLQRRAIIDEDYDPREEQMFQRFQTSNRTLADSLSEHINHPHEQQGQTTQINEQLFVKRIDERIDHYLSQNVGDIFNESIKSVILEQFAKERIAEVLKENEELIRKTVISVIKEIKSRNVQNKK